MKKQLLLVVLFISNVYSQSNDQKMLSDIYKFSLTRSSCYSWLDDLSNKIGARLSGSKGAEKCSNLYKAKIRITRSGSCVFTRSDGSKMG